MCTTCNGLGRVATSPILGKLIVEVESCPCVNDMQSLVRLEQELQVFEAKIEAFERRLQDADSL
ncbi:hypothetical protein [Priestia megaterium]|uniref:hypothetical protein n=1 Tax=Priestia megaterium TaxID=1404 RepID=UPI000BF59992|nr:hypothetical protein [Priestia megaterium]PFI93390.1 hypothetical protein COI84_19685 [Priestia megaterium]PGR11793.1 hypothetical protein COC62_14315 [Priestia megaterium]